MQEAKIENRRVGQHGQRELCGGKVRLSHWMHVLANRGPHRKRRATRSHCDPPPFPAARRERIPNCASNSGVTWESPENPESVRLRL